MMMRSRGWLTCVIVIAVFAASHLLREWWQSQGRTEGQAGEYKGVVTLAPSTTEVVFALGSGEEVIGVSRFVNYPPETIKLPKVGGYTDLNLEAVFRLRPKLVVLLDEQKDVVEKLSALGIDTVLVNHATVDGILESISEIGGKLGKREQAEALKVKLRAEIDSLRQDNPEHPRVLVCIGRDLGTGNIKQIIAAGSAGYHRELLALAGGQNAYRGDIPFPTLTKEHILEMNPDVIIEMLSDEQVAEFSEESVRAEWQSLAQLKAVKNQRVHLLVGDVHFIPGPRIIQTLREIHKILQP